MTWALQSLQAVWWATQPIQAALDAAFQTLVGAAPNSVQSGPMGSVATGILAQRLYRLQKQGNRLDLFVTPHNQASSQFPLFPDLHGEMADLRGRLQAISAVAGDVTRLAIVANVSSLSQSAEDANNALLQLTGITLPFTDGRDFLLQVNRRWQAVSIANLNFNRLVKWLAENYQMIDMATGTANVRSIDIATISADVNTVPAQNFTLSVPQQSPVFDELIAEAERICTARTLIALQ